jgi:predicted methyltransferase
LVYQQYTRATHPERYALAGAAQRGVSNRLLARGFLRRFIEYIPSAEHLALGEMIERLRPAALREFDQIPMRTPDLVRQSWAMVPLLVGRTVAFVGDSDATCLMLGLLATRTGLGPDSMMLLDFDRRLLARARVFADEHGFGHRLAVQAYNVLDPLPQDLIGRYDWFYTNPPYGSRNAGLSARLFLNRGIELAKRCNGQGCAILPCDPERPWTQDAWRQTRHFLDEYGWAVTHQLAEAHRYHLDDDPELTSTVILLRHRRPHGTQRLPFQGRRVEMTEIADFYGRGVQPPFPRYIREDGSHDYDWDGVGVVAA